MLNPTGRGARRYTLAVMSPLYLESNFTELENVLAGHLGLEKSQRRLLAIMRQPCTPRLGIQARLWLDMTDDQEFDLNVQRLVYELGLPEQVAFDGGRAVQGCTAMCSVRMVKRKPKLLLIKNN